MANLDLTALRKLYNTWSDGGAPEDCDISQMELDMSGMSESGQELLESLGQLLDVAEAAARLEVAGQNLLECTAVRESGSCGQCEGMMKHALAAYRKASEGK